MKSFIALILVVMLAVAAYSEAGLIVCSDDANVRACASRTCRIKSYVVRRNKYSSDCYELGAPVNINNAVKNKWYRINLKAGGYGYVNAHYCYGSVGQC